MTLLGPSSPASPPGANDFPKALATVLRFEGGYSENPADPGGATMRGVTQKVYDRYRMTRQEKLRPVREIGEAELWDIYRRGYWEPMDCDAVAWPLNLFRFDTAVNCGIRRAKLLAEDAPDGKTYLDHREAFYRRLCQQKPSLLVFLRGWLRRITVLRGFLTE